jgi:hypothetical protein
MFCAKLFSMNSCDISVLLKFQLPGSPSRREQAAARGAVNARHGEALGITLSTEMSLGAFRGAFLAGGARPAGPSSPAGEVFFLGPRLLSVFSVNPVATCIGEPRVYQGSSRILAPDANMEQKKKSKKKGFSYTVLA